MVAPGTWVWRDGARLTPAILRDLNALNDEFRRVWGVQLLASSGIRTDDEQERIFRERYVPASQVNGRRVYDFRWWNGVQWARISAAGTVAVPGTSNHQLGGGRKGAVDVRDTGSDAGVLTAGSPRARWLVANAPRFGFSTDEGYSVGEPWHLRYLGDPWADAPAPASTPGQGTPYKEDDMPLNDNDILRIQNAVWGHRGGADAPMIINRRSGQPEYPADTLGWMQERIGKETLAPQVKSILDAIGGLVASIFKLPIRRQGLPDGHPLAGKDTNFEQTVAWLDRNLGLAQTPAAAIEPDVLRAALTDALSGTTLDPDEIARNVADEQDRRNRERLEQKP